MFTIFKFNNITFVRHGGDLILPTNLPSLVWFKETLNNLFIFKHHLEHLEKIIEQERSRLEYKEQLEKLRPEKRVLNLDAEPNDFLTPVNKRSKGITQTGDEDSVST